MPLLAADWFEILAALIFFLITGVAQWIQKRAQEKRGVPPMAEPGPFGDAFGRTSRDAPPPLPERPTPAPMEDWETQLRRILEPGHPHVPPPPPPPLVEALPPRVGQGGHDEEAPSWETLDSPHRSLASFGRADAAAQRGQQLETDTDARITGIGQLSTASQAIGQAAGLHDAVAARMRGALAQTESHSTNRNAARPGLHKPSVAAATRALLRNPATVRQAFVASIVLQPPKALER